MRRFAQVALVIGLGLGLALAGGCGADDDVVETGDRPSTTGGPVSGDITLTIQVVSDGVQVRDGSLACGPDGAEGTGHLADSAAARAACDLLASNSMAVNLLANGREPGMMCTQQYGGPEVARVSGTIGDRPVDRSIDRVDGCGIAEWNLLEPVLGPPTT